MRGNTNSSSDEHEAADREETVAAAVAAATVATTSEERSTLDHNNVEREGQLAADPEVVRLLAELQAELDVDGSNNGSDTEVGGGGEEEEVEGVEGVEDSNEENVDGDDDDVDDDDGKEDLEASGGDIKKAKDNGPVPPAREERTISSAEGGATTVVVERPGLPRHMEHAEQQQQQQQHRSEEGSIDISRMKIDAPHYQHHRHQQGRGGARPRSAPSACLSAGGFSRLSSRTSSSSHFARTVSQKLLQATKEVEEQRATALSEGGCAGEAAGLLKRSGTPASAIAQADGRISVVKQNAEALQVCVCVCVTKNCKKTTCGRSIC